MQPYYQDKYVQIFHGDCRDILPALTFNKAQDYILTDPPYGINLMGKESNHLGLSRKKYAPIVDDDKTLDLQFLLDMFDKLIIFGGNYFSLPISKSWIVWDKDHFAERSYADVELIWTNLGMPARLIKCQWDGFTRKGETGEKQHPTQKPEELVGKLLVDYCGAAKLIVDPYLGSGTTAFCCKKLHKSCIGIELKEEYCEVAANRCMQEFWDFGSDNHETKEQEQQMPMDFGI